MVSVKLISAMPSAAGHSISSRLRSGLENAGSPPGTVPTTLTPAASSPSSDEAAIAPPMAITGAGARGNTLATSTRHNRVATATSSVVIEL